MISIYRIIIAISMFSSLLFSMVPHNKQLEFCAARREYDKNYHSEIKYQTNPICPFCDEKSLSENFIIEENRHTDVRIMMNKFPYPDWQQGKHLLFMPISHNAALQDLSQEVIDAEQIVSAKLYDTSYSQESSLNLGSLAGQSVKDHIHKQFKDYEAPPYSLPKRMKHYKNSSITTIEQAFERTKKKLDYDIVLIPKPFLSHADCDSCFVANNPQKDEKNFVVVRFKHNFVCLSHYPSFPAEISVVCNNHVHAIKDISQQAWRENMALAKALLPKVKEYAAAHIRESDGGNIFTKSLGAKASEKERDSYHLHTIIAPRTSIQPTPGTMTGNSSILLYDPEHLYQYLQSQKEELQSLINKEQ